MFYYFIILLFLSINTFCMDHNSQNTFRKKQLSREELALMPPVSVITEPIKDRLKRQSFSEKNPNLTNGKLLVLLSNSHTTNE